MSMRFWRMPGWCGRSSNTPTRSPKTRISSTYRGRSSTSSRRRAGPTRGDLPEFFHRLRGKIGKLRRASVFFAENYAKVTDHTNWQMAALSLSACVRGIDEILAEVPRGMPASPTSVTPNRRRRVQDDRE